MAEPDPRFGRAIALHEAGRIEEARQAYREVPDESPYAFKALNNLGTLLEQERRLDEAIAAYRRAIELRSDSEALHYNLAYALHQQDRLDEAIESYQRALQINPGLALARYNFGNALYQQRRYEEAAREFGSVAATEPASVAALRRLGDALFKLRRTADAVQAYQRAAQLAPDSAHEQFNLGKALHLFGRPDDAVASYRRSIALDPNQSAAYENLGRLLSRLGRTEEAADLYRQWLAVSPDNPAPAHLLAALTEGTVPGRASDEYVRQSFDQFAEDFETALQRLNYRAPELLVQALAEVVGPPERRLEILDAGCGTGLCGPLLSPYARRLVGVDLSPGMLQRARDRGVYDALLEAEITQHLQSAPESYDAIVAADVLVYFGDLGAALRGASSALRAGGWLAFTLEHLQQPGSDAGFRLNPHGRYSHMQEYALGELRAAGLEPRQPRECVLRTEGGEPVQGLLLVARKGSHAVSS